MLCLRKVFFKLLKVDRSAERVSPCLDIGVAPPFSPATDTAPLHSSEAQSDYRAITLSLVTLLQRTLLLSSVKTRSSLIRSLVFARSLPTQIGVVCITYYVLTATDDSAIDAEMVRHTTITRMILG